MYNTFFGFREKPFKLVPNPAYFFLSKCHEEALAHLKYAISQGDGFVLITGEVGTGKTTLCRAFLESVDSNTKAAYIFNPKLGPKQLLMAINDEFGITSTCETTKELIDILNTFLMQNKILGHRVFLLIDEAQNLSKQVLEQLRLVSNLETNSDKLLQIILVGQPELGDMLDSHALRQIGQRITLSYHLTPLSFSETKEYIQYRINIAAQRRGIRFYRSAYRQIFRYSGGIPRLINIVCDRAFLTAFVLNQQKITGNIIKASIRELSGRGADKGYERAYVRKGLALTLFLAIALLAVTYHQPLMQQIQALKSSAPPPKIGSQRSAEPAVQASETPAAIQGQIENPIPAVPEKPAVQIVAKGLADYLPTMDAQSSRYLALNHVMELWNESLDTHPYLESIADDPSFFRLASKTGGFSIHRIEGNLKLLMRLNLPAILEFYPPGGSKPGYLTLSKISGDRIELGGTRDANRVETNPEEIEFYWSGVAYILWKNYLSIWGTIPYSNQDSIVTLKLLLQDIGFSEFEINADYDQKTQAAIEMLQSKYGVPVDGFVGPLTKIILYREKKSFDMPRLIRP